MAGFPRPRSRSSRHGSGREAAVRRPIVAAIGLTLRRRPGTKYLDPSRQVFVKREGRVQLVKMAPEKKLENR